MFSQMSVRSHLGRGYPHPADGVGIPPSSWQGRLPIWPIGRVPPIWPMEVVPIWLMGVTPVKARWGTPPVRTGWGYPLGWDWTPIRTGWGFLPPPRQSSIASTCYAAGGVPLVFTQEDFLVLKCNRKKFILLLSIPKLNVWKFPFLENQNLTFVHVFECN